MLDELYAGSRKGRDKKKGVVLLKTDTTGFKFLNKYFAVFKII
jgi:hypothetical protein